MRRRRRFEQFRDKALKKPGVREKYDALGPAFEMKRQMIAMRKAAGLSQEQMAELLGTQKSNFSRLESLNTDVSPRLSMVEQYAKVLGYRDSVSASPSMKTSEDQLSFEQRRDVDNDARRRAHGHLRWRRERGLPLVPAVAHVAVDE